MISWGSFQHWVKKIMILIPNFLKGRFIIHNSYFLNPNWSYLEGTGVGGLKSWPPSRPRPPGCSCWSPRRPEPEIPRQYNLHLYFTQIELRHPINFKKNIYIIKMKKINVPWAVCSHIFHNHLLTESCTWFLSNSF